MLQLAQDICDMMPDYHSFNNFKFTPDKVIIWVNQFDTTDQQFIQRLCGSAGGSI
jgi:hypothetical protein